MTVHEHGLDSRDLSYQRMVERMAASRPPDNTFAVQHEVQYTPIEVLGDIQVSVRDTSDREAVLLCHASRALGVPYLDVTHVLVVVHGALRNSQVYLNHAQRAAELSGALDSTLIVAPQFLADVDAFPGRPLPQGSMHWDVENWKGGGFSLGPASISSFKAMDCLLRKVTHTTWPTQTADSSAAESGRTVFIVGNSAGGQFVNRYAAVGREPRHLEAIGIRTRFLISNPSTYVYFSADRPVDVIDRSEVNRWRYGFDDPVSYVDGTARQYLEEYLSRDVTMILGEEDHNDADLLLVVSPPAMAQGANRLERGLNYFHHVEEVARSAGLEVRHQLITLPGVGHDAGDVLAAHPTRELLFA